MELQEIRQKLEFIGRKKKSGQKLSENDILFISEMKQSNINQIRSWAAEITPNETLKALKKDPDFGFIRALGKNKYTAMNTAHARV